MGVGIVWPQPDGFIQLGHSLIEAPRRHQYTSKVVAAVGIFGPQLHHLRKLARRFARTALLQQKCAIPRMRTGVDRLELDRFLILVLGFAHLSGPPQDGRQIDVCLGIVRIESQRFQYWRARFLGAFSVR